MLHADKEYTAVYDYSAVRIMMVFHDLNLFTPESMEGSQTRQTIRVAHNNVEDGHLKLITYNALFLAFGLGGLG